MIYSVTFITTDQQVCLVHGIITFAQSNIFNFTFCHKSEA